MNDLYTYLGHIVAHYMVQVAQRQNLKYTNENYFYGITSLRALNDIRFTLLHARNMLEKAWLPSENRDIEDMLIAQRTISDALNAYTRRDGTEQDAVDVLKNFFETYLETQPTANA